MKTGNEKENNNNNKKNNPKTRNIHREVQVETLQEMKTRQQDNGKTET